MQTGSKRPRARPAPKEVAPQLERFKAMARELGADESPGALDRSFLRLAPKKRAAPAKAKKPK
jgi:hypothetical protein